MKDPTKVLSLSQSNLLIKQNKIYSKKTKINKNRSTSADIHFSKRANMSIQEANEIFLNSKKIEHSIVSNKKISLSVIMPYFRAGDIGWIPLEALIRQKNIDFYWEIIVIEENFENPFGLKNFIKYFSRLKEVNCVKFTYISLKSWLPLSSKWFFLINSCDKNSKFAALNSCDVYFSEYRLKKQFYDLKNSNKNWHKIKGNYIYDVDLDMHVKINFDKNRSDSSCTFASLDLLKKLPLDCIRINIDGWRFRTLNSNGKVNLYYDDSEIISESTVSINGFGSISISRKERIKNITPPFIKCCTKLQDHIPKKIVSMLKEKKKCIDNHNMIIKKSNIKMR